MNRIRLRWFGLVLLSYSLVAFSGLGWCQTEEPETEFPYDSVWSSLRELLQRREYGSALSLLDSLVDDPSLTNYSAQIEADRAVVAQLKELHRLVRLEVGTFREGAEYSINGANYTFRGLERDAKGEWVVLMAGNTPRRLLIVDLTASTWLDLVQRNLEELPKQSLTIGVFLAFDRFPDAKAARKSLDDAGASGEPVVIWLERLNAEVQLRSKRLGTGSNPNKEDDQLVGKWRVAVKRSKHPVQLNLEFKSNGHGNGGVASWEKDAVGRYRVTLQQGGVAQVNVSGNRLWGKMTGGAPVVGVRQTKP